ncbi:MAG: DUF21 domain-containing protein [Tepidisphaera sp.]|nr:DUF21 domain-containing protein [Tepidisphaera sp.]
MRPEHPPGLASVNSNVWLFIGVVALGVGSVLSALVQSLRELSRPALEQLAAIHQRGRERVEKIADDPEGHAAAIALPRTACNLVVAIAVVMWVAMMRGLAVPTWVEMTIGAAAASLLIWLFGQVLPSSVAKHAAEVTVFAWSPVLRFAYVVGRPFTGLARWMDEIVRRLAGQEHQDKAEAVQEELLEAVEEAEQEGTVDAVERDMIEAVVNFRDKTVAQVMTPRTEIQAMELSTDLSGVTAAVRSVGHSRIPVYEDSLDHVVGVFYVKDLMKWLAGEGSRNGKPFSLRALLRPAYFVPETKTIRQLLAELLSRRTHIAMVADEYGGTAGLITIEDIVEEVFGDIQDEYEEPEADAAEVKIDAATRSAEIDARAYIHDANDALAALGAELPESEDYDTVGGFVTVTMGRIPAPGETFRHDDLTLTVLAAEPTRVTRVRLVIASHDGATDPNAERQASGAATP